MVGDQAGDPLPVDFREAQNPVMIVIAIASPLAAFFYARIDTGPMPVNDGIGPVPHNGQTGWKFGYEGPVEEADLSEAPDTLLYEEDSLSFYKVLPRILQTFYDQPDDFLDLALGNLRLNVPIFNTHRMAAEYVATYGLDLEPTLASSIRAFGRLYESDAENS